ncbi:MAG: DUF4372 domain-containing protein [Clostridia bacterium]|nr:DUF4372 domain-containing protein [Clostridia bacterium]
MQLFSFLLKPGFGQNIHHLGADRYVKKVMTVQLIILFALAQLKKHRGLREISLSLAEEALASALNPDSISAAQLSRRMRTLPAEACTSLVQITAHAISMRCGLAAVQQELGRLYLIDSHPELLHLPLGGVSQDQKRGQASSEARFWSQGVLPDQALMTTARISDKSQMEKLVVEDREALNVFDRGYVDYKKFDACRRNPVCYPAKGQRG